MSMNGRDSRRRRIVERGNDRLALITGRIPTLTSDTGSGGGTETGSETRHSYTSSCPTWISQNHLVSEQSSPVSVSGSGASTPLLFDRDHGIEPGEHDESDGKSRTTPFMRKCESNIETSREPALDLDHKEQLFPDSSTLNPPCLSASDGGQLLKLKSNYHNIFAPNKISSAIAASESIRFNFSLVAAILVLVSYNSHFFKVVLFFRPLLLLMLTNISIVIARLLAEEAGSQRNQKAAANSIPAAGMVDQIGKALELGLLLQNVMGAMFMDCSIYSITVVCGVSVAQKLGW
ncbi:hypothetical protein FXO38_33955 [Capsicum annuum]|uniref:Uncharacterized protein n=1 Tax=Capsicum annuum TaxID=4072 RepID=A0A1U8DSC6_CAPAN|nr:uncharacterized protein LOC107839079 [Capsicum annuum]KAF3616862.1 hypothetical protein FXO37_34906 [Capsicum annuum]KAF3617496.1 hypothetical protein FXO38_33955 [Capsicum annuum]PHT74393.1 hypothetical protein T459_21670 [Capsicum annuum]